MKSIARPFISLYAYNNVTSFINSIPLAMSIAII